MSTTRSLYPITIDCNRCSPLAHSSPPYHPPHSHHPFVCPRQRFLFPISSVCRSLAHSSQIPPSLCLDIVPYSSRRPTMTPDVCHGGQPLVGFPSVLAFNPNDHGSLFGMVPAGLEPSTGLLGLVGYLRVVTWSIGKAGSRSCDGLHGHRVKDVPMTYI